MTENNDFLKFNITPPQNSESPPMIDALQFRENVGFPAFSDFMPSFFGDFSGLPLSADISNIFSDPNFAIPSNFSFSNICGNGFTSFGMQDIGFDSFVSSNQSGGAPLNRSGGFDNWSIAGGNRSGTSGGKPRYDLGVSTKISPYFSSNPSMRQRMVENAHYYVGKVNGDRTGNALFSGGHNRAWCADFVTSITKKSFGSSLPSGFGYARRGNNSYGPSSVCGLMYWAQDHNCYLEVPSTGKAAYIAQNVKPGDIMIEKRNGKSHTGVVKEVHADGSFVTIEGNASNSVAERTYTANSSTLSGFVSLA